MAGKHVERAVGFGDGEQERHARERDEKAGWKAGDHRFDLHACRVDADGPRQRDSQEAYIDARGHAEADRHQQREERENGGRHAFHGGKRCFCTLPSAVRGSASTRTNARGVLNDASWARHRSVSSASSDSSATMYAIGISPRTASATPTTVASRTRASSSNTSSISRG